jgi:hypothetical protein
LQSSERTSDFFDLAIHGKTTTPVDFKSSAWIDDGLVKEAKEHASLNKCYKLEPLDSVNSRIKPNLSAAARIGYSNIGEHTLSPILKPRL